MNLVCCPAETGREAGSLCLDAGKVGAHEHPARRTRNPTPEGEGDRVGLTDASHDDPPEGGAASHSTKAVSIPHRSEDRAAARDRTRERKVNTQGGCEGTIPRGKGSFLAC
jgi:hypothetical protein